MPLDRAARRLAAASLLAASALAPARAGEAGVRHAAWRDCLAGAYAAGAPGEGAADAALRACRPAQRVYGEALAASPLLDADDVARAGPALAARARARLLTPAAADLAETADRPGAAPPRGLD